MIEAAAAGIGWGRGLPRDRDLGIAGHFSFLTYVAAVAEVEVGDRWRHSIPRVDIAVDCGPVVNPDRVRAQMEGAAVMGAGIATSAEISFRNGPAEQNNYDTYELTRWTAPCFGRTGGVARKA